MWVLTPDNPGHLQEQSIFVPAKPSLQPNETGFEYKSGHITTNWQADSCLERLLTVNKVTFHTNQDGYPVCWHYVMEDITGCVNPFLKSFWVTGGLVEQALLGISRNPQVWESVQLWCWFTNQLFLRLSSRKWRPELRDHSRTTPALTLNFTDIFKWEKWQSTGEHICSRVFTFPAVWAISSEVLMRLRGLWRGSPIDPRAGMDTD